MCTIVHTKILYYSYVDFLQKRTHAENFWRLDGISHWYLSRATLNILLVLNIVKQTNSAHAQFQVHPSKPKLDGPQTSGK